MTHEASYRIEPRREDALEKWFHRTVAQQSPIMQHREPLGLVTVNSGVYDIQGEPLTYEDRMRDIQERPVLDRYLYFGQRIADQLIAQGLGDRITDLSIQKQK